jgi:hypothetical protein
MSGVGSDDDPPVSKAESVSIEIEQGFCYIVTVGTERCDRRVRHMDTDDMAWEAGSKAQLQTL